MCAMVRNYKFLIELISHLNLMTLSRTRKIRCDGAKPTCHNCGRRAGGGGGCTYDAAPKRRGPDKTPGARQRTVRDPSNDPDTDGGAVRRRRRRRDTSASQTSVRSLSLKRTDSYERSSPDSLQSPITPLPVTPLTPLTDGNDPWDSLVPISRYSNAALRGQQFLDNNEHISSLVQVRMLRFGLF